jgi:DNA-directed RNA polymerase specialized sigma24 family protein
MSTINLCGTLPNGDGADIEQFLEQLDAYIVTLVRKKIPRYIVLPEVLDLEIDELVQKVRIKIWLACKSKCIANPKAYINRIVYTEVVDMLRQHKPTLQLLIDDDGELYQGNTIVKAGEEMQDPASKFEEKEALAEYIVKAIDGILELPPCQEQAMICSLKDQVDDVAQLIQAFKAHKVDIERINWPAEKADKQRLKASLTVCRKKLRQFV